RRSRIKAPATKMPAVSPPNTSHRAAGKAYTVAAATTTMARPPIPATRMALILGSPASAIFGLNVRCRLLTADALTSDPPRHVCSQLIRLHQLQAAATATSGV